jgi:DNA-binding Lrp family transcriptional regulator
MGLKTAPPTVRQAFEELRRSLGKPLSLHRISGQHYVYEYQSSRSPKSGKTVIKTFYIGHITDEGKYIAKGQKGLAGLEVREESFRELESTAYDERDAIALRNLSMNGRMSMAKLAKRIGMSVTGTRHFVRRLEKKYNIRYFAEVNTLKLGYLRYIALVKFEDKIPSVKEVKEAFEDDPHVALVAMTKGIYDMVVIFYLESNALISNFIYDWRRSKALSRYTAKWYITPLDMASGITIPLRKKVVEWVTEGATPKTEKDRQFGTRLTKIEGLILKEMTVDGAQDFNEIDKKYSWGLGRSNYAFYKLVKNGVIERTTITVVPSHLSYNAIFVTETNNYKKFTENQDQRYLNLISRSNPLIDKYVFRGDMGIPDSIFQICPIFDPTTFQNIREELNFTPGTRTDSMIITDILVGSLCYRNFDPTYTTIYDTLIKHGKVVKNKIVY